MPLLNQLASERPAKITVPVGSVSNRKTSVPGSHDLCPRRSVRERRSGDNSHGPSRVHAGTQAVLRPESVNSSQHELTARALSDLCCRGAAFHAAAEALRLGFAATDGYTSDGGMSRACRARAALCPCRWSPSDLNLAARACERILVCDTDAFATSVWHERYLSERSPAVERIAEDRRRPGTKIDLYLLTGVGIPFVQDGYRDGEHIRDWMHRRFLERLTETGRPFLVVSGTREERLGVALEAVRRLPSAAKRAAALTSGVRLSDPIAGTRA